MLVSRKAIFKAGERMIRERRLGMQMDIPHVMLTSAQIDLAFRNAAKKIKDEVKIHG